MASFPDGFAGCSNITDTEKSLLPIHHQLFYQTDVHATTQTQQLVFSGAVIGILVFFDTLHWLTCLAIILVLVFSDTFFNMCCNHTPTFRAGCSHRRNKCSIFSNHTVTADMETCFHWIETDNKEVFDHTSRSIGMQSPDNLTRHLAKMLPQTWQCAPTDLAVCSHPL